MNQPAEEKKDVGESIEIVINRLLTKASLERLRNIKMVDLERYYKVEKILLDIHAQGMHKIEDKQFLVILQSTEVKKSTITYSRRAGMLDLDD